MSEARSQPGQIGQAKPGKCGDLLAAMDLRSRQVGHKEKDSKTSLKVTEREGRHLVASAKISQHDAIFCDEASFAVLTKSHRKQVLFKPQRSVGDVCHTSSLT